MITNNIPHHAKVPESESIELVPLSQQSFRDTDSSVSSYQIPVNANQNICQVTDIKIQKKPIIPDMSISLKNQEQKSQPVIKKMPTDGNKRKAMLKRAFGMKDILQEDFQQQIDNIYRDRAIDTRNLNIGVLASNLVFQLQALKTLDTMNEIIIQSIYWVAFIISGVLITFSYRPGRLNLIKYSFVILTARNILRLFNFEKVESSNFVNAGQQCLCVFLMQMFVVNHQKSTQNYRIRQFMTLFWAFGQITSGGFFESDHFGAIQVLTIISIIITQYSMLAIILEIQQRIINNLLKKTENHHNIQDELFQILGNLESSIIIMSDFRAEYINERFLCNFSKNIIDKVPQEIEMQKKEKGKSSRVTKVKNYVKKKFGLQKEDQQILQEPIIVPKIMKVKLFKIFQTQGQRFQAKSQIELIEESKLMSEYSFEEILEQFESHELNKVVFIFTEENNDQQVYFRISMKKFMRKDKQKIMFEFIDISKKILYDMEKSHNAVLGMINACVSHEMRNPLNSIIAQNIEKREIYQEIDSLIKEFRSEIINQKTFLQKHDDITQRLKSGLKIQQSSSNILTFIVQDLLDYAQIKSGKFRKNIQEFNIISAVEEVMLIQQRKAQDNKIKFHATFLNIKSDGQEHNIEYNHQDEKYGYMVNTDQQRVQQVLLGLQSNALKFTQGGEVNIRVKLIQEENVLQIEVKDTGVGISKRNQDKLFKLFGFLEETKKVNQNGVGLGLVISKQITEQFGGDITLKSKLGKGSKFTFRFKLSPVEDNQEVNEVEQTQFQANSKRLVYKWRPTELKHDYRYVYRQEIIRSGSFIGRINSSIFPPAVPYIQKFDRQKILIVDDQSFNVEALMIILRYTIGLDSKKFCDCALSGAQALQMIKDDVEYYGSSKYSLILMDCNMPEMDGYETTSEIREYLYSKKVTQPIISAITGHMEQIYIDKAIQYGMNQVLSKPVNSFCLKDLVENMGFPIKIKKQ